MHQLAFWFPSRGGCCTFTLREKFLGNRIALGGIELHGRFRFEFSRHSERDVLIFWLKDPVEREAFFKVVEELSGGGGVYSVIRVAFGSAIGGLVPPEVCWADDAGGIADKSVTSHITTQPTFRIHVQLFAFSLRDSHTMMFLPRLSAIGRPATNRATQCLGTARPDAAKNLASRILPQQRPQSTSTSYTSLSQCLHRPRQELLWNKIPRQRRYRSGTARGAAKSLFKEYPFSVTAAAILYFSPIHKLATVNKIP
jgi:hypothetical protein